jgi:hypothetical protein
MHDMIYELRREVEALKAEVEELKKFQAYFRPDFRERAVKKTSKSGIDAEVLATNWLREKGYTWEDQTELTKILRDNERLRVELLGFINGRGPECSSQSWGEITNFIRSINPTAHQHD